MLILESLSTCSSTEVAVFVNLIKQVLIMVQIIAPVIAIASLTFIFIKFMSNPDDKKLGLKVKNSLIALVFVFLIPLLVNVTMKLCDDKFDLSTCWNYEEKVEVFGSSTTYIETSNRKQSQSIIIDSSKYEVGGINEDDSNLDLEDSSNETTSENNLATKIKIQYNVKDSKGRCGTGSGDTCIQVATVSYGSKTVKYYMGRQDNSGLLGGSCRSHAFMCATNATKNSTYSTLDLQNYLYSTGDKGVLKGEKRFNRAINYYNVKAKAYFEETSIADSISLASKALNDGNPVIIFVANSKCSDLATSHHALLLLGYDENNNVVFLDSCGRYKTAKKRNLEELGQCMSGNSVAKNWMRMVIFSF